jgi:hypothetical protein
MLIRLLYYLMMVYYYFIIIIFNAQDDPSALEPSYLTLELIKFKLRKRFIMFTAR